MMDSASLQEAKRALRAEIRARLKASTEEALAHESLEVCHRFAKLPQMASAKCILLYWPMPRELDLRPLMQEVMGPLRIALPVVIGERTLELREYTGEACLRAVPPYGILEPQGTPLVKPREVEIVAVPGVAFDRNGGRIGHGKGYYDSLLERMPHALKIGVGFALQLVDKVPMECHDWRLDAIICGV